MEHVDLGRLQRLALAAELVCAVLEMDDTCSPDELEQAVDNLNTEAKEFAQERKELLESLARVRDNILHDPDHNDDTINWALDYIDDVE